MGHVDHGKTSLLDALKSTNVVSREAGGITQHIGAYKVELVNGKSISFIDTPGHEAFTEMRIRGAKVTDIVVLVVAADDGIKTQTVEAINHAKAANVPIIVAINKIDKPDINIDKVKNELLSHGLVSEDLGGDIIIVPVSALKKTNLDKLEEAILLVAEMQDLRASSKGAASGAVIESRVDKGRGVVTTILVQRGILKIGDLVVAGSTFGRIKRMNNDKGIDVEAAYPSDPVEIYGLDEAPMAGDRFNVVSHEKQARDIAEYRLRKAKEKKVSTSGKSSLEELFLKASGEGMVKDLPIILKADVQGSIEAITGSLGKLPNTEVNPKIIHTGVGAITESDVNLAMASKAIILGFNVRAVNNAASLADREKVDLRYYSIIYNLIDDVKAIMTGMLSPIIREEYIGSVDVRQIFNITKVGKVAGSYVTKGMIKRGAGVRLLRENVVIHEGKLKTLKRFKDDVKEVKEGFECGIAFENYDDIRVGDTLEVFEIVVEKKQLQ
jgi:translation initiation factor IF-2